jgi:hypothetical protein
VTVTEAAICSLPTVTRTAGVYGAGWRAERPREDVEGVRILGGAKETVGIEAGEDSTFAHFLTSWGMMLEFVSFPNGRKYMENRDQLLWSPVNPAA